METYKFKTKDSDLNAAHLCLGNVSKDFPVANMKSTGLYEYVYDFSVDDHSIDVDDILHTHQYFIEKHNMKYV